MKRRHALGAAGAVAAVLALSSYASPYWTLHRMNTAIAEKDAERFSRYIDFPALRASVKGRVLAVTGQTRNLHATLAGVGNLDAEKLRAEIVDLDMSGPGGASVRARAAVNLNLSRIGSATVYGSPRSVTPPLVAAAG